MHAGREFEIRNGGGINVDKSDGRMPVHQMAAATLAVLTLAERRLGECRDLIGALRETHGIGLPQNEGGDGGGSPGAARIAVAITHGFRCAGDLDFDRAAKAASRIRHVDTSTAWR